jgi:hypothetical protein
MPRPARHNHDHEGDLAQLDTHVEADQGPHQRVARKIELGQRRGKAQAVDQAENHACRRGEPYVRGRHSDPCSHANSIKPFYDSEII